MNRNAELQFGRLTLAKDHCWPAGIHRAASFSFFSNFCTFGRMTAAQ
jgi:hypothetical protein